MASSSALAFPGGLEGGEDLVKVMAVNFQHVPVKSLKFFIQRLGGHHIGGAPVDLEAVHIHEHTEIIQMPFGGGHGGFPDLPLGQLSIAAEGVAAVALAPKPGGQRHAYGSAQPLAQGTGGHIHPRHMVHIRMPGIMALDGTEKFHIFHGEEAPQCQNGVQSGRTMPLGEHKAITPGPFGLGRSHMHLVKIKSGEHIHTGEGAAGMAGSGGIHGIHGQQPGLGGHEPQVFATELFHVAIPFAFKGFSLFTRLF